MNGSKHADFYVAVATALPVLYIVIAFQTRIYRDLIASGRRLEPWVEKWLPTVVFVMPPGGKATYPYPPWQFYLRATPIVSVLLPLSSIGVACAALMFEYDQRWTRIWAATGLGLVLLFAAIEALALSAVEPDEQA
jgi:hypothetical protein